MQSEHYNSEFDYCVCNNNIQVSSYYGYKKEHG